MVDFWISLEDIPAEGREFSFTDLEQWSAPVREYGVPCRVDGPMQARVHVIPRDDGALLKGTTTGRVHMDCDRCTARAPLDLDFAFTVLEDAQGDDEAEEPRVRLEGDHLEVNVGRVLWEQFVLHIPAKHLCRRTCKGLCPMCGADLNQAACGCEPEEGDPRLAVLRDLKISSS
jgi:uncharacterized protein